MSFVCWGLVILLLGLTWLNFHWASRFQKLIVRTPPTAEEKDLPPAVVVLAMRGADPFLPDCLAGLLNQDYPDYDVKIIIDSREDPAASVVSNFLNSHDKSSVEVLYLENPSQQCSLKVSALIQVIDKLDERYQVVTVLDADVITESDWLRSLVTPLVNDPELAASTGIRWFMPSERELGNMVRRHWNIGAVIQMALFQIPWGGSLAIRRSFFEEADLLEHWSKCLCEDTPLASAIQKIGRRLETAPEAFMINRESTSLSGAVRFIGRQLLFTQLYHPRWFSVMLPGILNAVTPLVGLIVFGVALWQGNSWAWLLPGAIILQSASVLLQATLTGKKIKQMLVSKGVFVRKSVFDRKTFLAAFLAVFTHFWGVVRPVFVREIEWRGITYRRTRGKQFELVEYQPYGTDEEAELAESSI
ncbi:MAG: glycosyltransferase family 2 protein [Planctomycetaceae bacterium]|nr:glycosyltransferase family 2 protein [Planctomycetaceae bacterium]